MERERQGKGANLEEAVPPLQSLERFLVEDFSEER